MAENVKIQINTQDIIAKLHNDAMENIGNSEYTILNSLIEFDKADKNENPRIMVMKKDNSEITKDEKSKCIEILKEYVKYFAGENFSKLIDDSNVYGFGKDEQNGEKETEEKDQKQDNSDQSKESENGQNDNSKNQGQTQNQGQNVGESTLADNIFVNSFDRKLENDIDFIFEDLTTVKIFVGYCIAYTFQSGGRYIVNLAKSGFKSVKRKFGGILADLANMKIQTSKGDINIGRAIAKGMRAFRKTRINANDVDNHILGILPKQCGAIVRVYDTASLSASLIKQGKWEPQYEVPFKDSENAVTIEISERSKSYDLFNKRYIAEVCTKAFGDADKFRMFKGNVVHEENVIKIENYSSEFVDQSIFNRKNPPKNGPSATSENYNPFYQKSAQKLLDFLFEASGGIPNGQVEVTFFVKNPTIMNPVRNKLSTLRGPEGNVLSSHDAVEIPDLSVYQLSGFQFNGWKPDPNDFHPKPGEAKHLDTEADFSRKQSNEQHDLYIVPHPMIGYYNRKDEYVKGNDGTITSVQSKAPYKASDFSE